MSSAAARCRALVPTHSVRARHQDMFHLLIHAPTFILFSRKQSAGRDRRPEEWCMAGFCPHMQPGSTKHHLYSLDDTSQLLLRAAHQPTIYPRSCLVWLEETSDSLFALPEASLFLLVIVTWKCRLFPVSDIITITALSHKEIMFHHSSKGWSIESYIIFPPLNHSDLLCLRPNEYNH